MVALGSAKDGGVYIFYTPQKGVLCFQVFGMDVLEFMTTAGFDDAWVCCYMAADWGYLGANVMFVGEKARRMA